MAAEPLVEHIYEAALDPKRWVGCVQELVATLGSWSGVPVTYAGGIGSREDIDLIERLGNGRIDFTVGSALDIFGGSALAYQDVRQISRL